MLAQDSIRTINITVDFCALSLLVVLMVGMLAGAMHKKRLLLLSAMSLHLLSVLGFILLATFEGGAGKLARAAVLVGTYQLLVFAILTSVAITMYVYTDATAKPLHDPYSDGFVRLQAAVNSLNLLAVVLNPLTRIYFVVDANNVVGWGPLGLMSCALLLFQGSVMVPVVLRLTGVHDRATIVRMLLCGLIVIAASAASYAIHDLHALPMSISLVLALLAVGVQTRLEEDLAQARTEVAESRVRLLSGQIHPHFIFNSLNAIKALVVEDPSLAEQTIQDFSDYLRTHLDVMSSSRLVPFLQEIDHVRHYVSLEMADPVGPMEVAYDLQVTDFLIPPLTVQPLVENAIRHGVKTREGGGRVLLESHATDDAIVVSVTDDGKGISSVTQRQEERQRIGLDNVRERIERQCAGSLEVESKPTGTVARLILPRDGVS